MAAQSGHREVVQALIAAGADVNQQDHVAGLLCIGLLLMVIKQLLQALIAAGAAVNQQANDGIPLCNGLLMKVIKQ